jgi:hypothetical protein
VVRSLCRKVQNVRADSSATLLDRIMQAQGGRSLWLPGYALRPPLSKRSRSSTFRRLLMSKGLSGLEDLGRKARGECRRGNGFCKEG